MAKWTEGTTVKFVEEYLRHEMLWNFRSSNYRNKQARQKAINDIVIAMAIPDFGYKEVELKIKSIRSTYSQEIKKVKNSTKSGSGVDDLYKPNLKWFNILDDALKSVNIAEIKTTQNNMENIEEICREQNTEGNSSELNEGNIKENSLEDVTPIPTTAARKRKIRDLNLIVDKLDNVSKVVNAPKSTPPPEHEFDLFGKSIAGQLKAMPLIQALEAEQYIQNYLSQMRIKQLINIRRTSQEFSSAVQNTHYQYTPSPSTSTYSPSSTDNYINQPPTPTDNYMNQPPTPTDNYMNQPPTPTDSYMNQPPTPTDNYVNQPLSPTENYMNQSSTSTDNNISLLTTTRAPTPQNIITIQDSFSINDDILAQALASISNKEK